MRPRVHGGSCKTFHFRKFQSKLSCRFAWQAWRFVTFSCVCKRVERHFVWQAQYFCDIFRQWVGILVAGAALWRPPSSFCMASAALYTCRVACFLGTALSGLHTLHSTLYTLYLTLHTLHFTLHTLNFTLHTLHSTLYTLYLTLHTLHFTLHTLHFTLHTLYSTLYTPHSTLHTLHFTLHTLHFTLRTRHSTLHNLHFKVYILHYTLHTLHSTLYTPHSTLYTPNFALYTPDFTLYTPHFILHTLHSTLYTPHFTLYTSTLYTSHILLHTLHSTPFRIPQSTVHWCSNLGKMYKTVQITCFTKAFYVTAFGFVGCILFSSTRHSPAAAIRAGVEQAAAASCPNNVGWKWLICGLERDEPKNHPCDRYHFSHLKSRMRVLIF